jgi:hypothetical protein
MDPNFTSGTNLPAQFSVSKVKRYPVHVTDMERALAEQGIGVEDKLVLASVAALSWVGIGYYLYKVYKTS